MFKLKSFLLFLIFLLLTFSSSLLATDETLTITSYYPSPYGVYNEIRSKRMAIGDNYINSTNYTWEVADGDGGEVDYLADLIVEGNVGIGTTSPAEKLEVSGNIKLSGASATYKITNVANPTANQDVATKAYVDGGGGATWSGCYRKTCEVHNGASCSVAACGTGETDNGTACPRDGGLWNAQATSNFCFGGSTSGCIYAGSNFAADYYVTCERWCCK